MTPPLASAAREPPPITHTSPLAPKAAKADSAAGATTATAPSADLALDALRPEGRGGAPADHALDPWDAPRLRG